MTKNEFAALCGEYLIDPGVALGYPKQSNRRPKGFGGKFLKSTT